ncbi:hypothetical protein WAK64_15550 [Bacillus spongiae]|uniref:DUF4129 domain-containing protein n=1 Tax=Bacillus spongiae TaxID=2683610 RepID=A0ABU8HGQ1_9BACI
MKNKWFIIGCLFVMASLLSLLLTSVTSTIAYNVKSTFSSNDPPSEQKWEEPTDEGTMIENGTNGREGIPTGKKVDFPFPEENSTDKLTLYIYIILFLLIAVTVYFVRRRHVKKKKMEMSQNEMSVPVKKESSKVEAVEIDTHIIRSEELHEVREYVKRWEENLVDQKRKRVAETIQEWFQRIKGPVEIIPIYEKVRYGYGDCTEAELQLLIKRLKER